MAECSFPAEGAVIIGKQTRLVKSRMVKHPNMGKRQVNHEEDYANEQDQQPNANNAVDDYLNSQILRAEEVNMEADDHLPPTMHQEAENKMPVMR